ncbi:NAD-dependent epimerase [Vibrio sp. UCD-FRSSP16_10]|uniref:SDR family oxidoreductase n=1 Tax=unclassified Vibrio TaxID=2614977 RepID=UPI000801961E|nr:MULTISPECIES: aldehyde reductase [unclassified Vibrio]OBT13875.1 NAD-dependent epimerase [Vibrio sp. UCD-FRSSP16_30]OBT22756.1 NAD-dependent epimerase [Vibrio sp. UCD-FRSSP16_10]
MAKQTVLLTGISGFIGLHIAKQLLDKGFHVRGSIRNLKKAQSIKNTLQKASTDVSELSFIELDLTSDKGWDSAAKDCEYVMHVASPYAAAEPKHEDDMIKPAVDGSLRVLRAANKAGVKRVVLTSSAMTMMATMKSGTFGPNDWADTHSKDIGTYAKSKTLAEQAAWQFMEEQDSAMELVVVNPGGVFGPALGDDISGQSMTMIDQMLRGKIPMLANVAMPMVDVRDVAIIHVQAMTHTQAAGQRILASRSEPTHLTEIAKILKEHGYKGPSTRIAPNLLLRFMALFDSEAKGMVGLLNINVRADNSKTLQLFDWSPRPFAETVLDAATAVTEITQNK